MRNVYNISVGKAEGKKPLGRPSVHGRIILKWTSKKLGAKLWTGFIGSRYEPAAGSCEHGNPSDYIKGLKCFN
jgi:hypothetical protein